MSAEDVRDMKPILKEIINTEITKYFEKNETKIQNICKDIIVYIVS